MLYKTRFHKTAFVYFPTVEAAFSVQILYVIKDSTPTPLYFFLTFFFSDTYNALYWVMELL